MFVATNVLGDEGVIGGWGGVGGGGGEGEDFCSFST
jgi:hypothetical protein